ncbi:MAG: DUF98 domain-containing protein [Thermodesulfovibrionia bacterium]|nr:DUF98 domain-containing protein [Thermodesulfovibrionia bacterium]
MKEQKFLKSIEILKELGNISGIRLSLFQKIIAVTNGSITQLLEIYSGQTIVIDTISQEIGMPESDLSEFPGICMKDKVSRREVMIKGKYDEKVFAYARSYMPMKYLPPKLSQSLIKEDTPLGKLLIRHKIEGRRELNDVCIKGSREYDLKFMKYEEKFKGNKKKFISGNKFLIKKYNFISNGRIIIYITEVYPLSAIQ